MVVPLTYYGLHHAQEPEYYFRKVPKGGRMGA